MSRLKHSARKLLTRSEFALPPKKSGPNKTPSTVKGTYPVDTIGRARDALSRGAAHASPAQLATIKRRVHAAYPSIQIGGEAGK